MLRANRHYFPGKVAEWPCKEAGGIGGAPLTAGLLSAMYLAPNLSCHLLALVLSLEIA